MSNMRELIKIKKKKKKKTWGRVRETKKKKLLSIYGLLFKGRFGLLLLYAQNTFNFTCLEILNIRVKYIKLLI